MMRKRPGKLSHLRLIPLLPIGVGKCRVYLYVDQWNLTSFIHSAVEKLPTQEIKEIPRPEPVRPMGSIIKAMSSKKIDAFAGYGRHCINDFLYQLAIFPGTPCHIICRDELQYQQFKTHLHRYMARYSSDAFLDDTASIPNIGNPFTFNERSHRIYTSKYIDVFRRRSKQVPRDIYDQHVRQGLLDPKHTIGEAVPWSHLYS